MNRLKQILALVIGKHSSTGQTSGSTGSLINGTEEVNQSTVQELTTYLQEQFPNLEVSLHSLDAKDDKWGSIFYNWQIRQ